MKFFGKEIKEVKKGYFGIRRCTICNNELRDVDLAEVHQESYLCFIPVKSKIVGRILICNHCNAFMEIDDELWNYYSTYYNKRFTKTTTDNIIFTLKKLSKQMENNGVKLNISDKSDTKSLDLIYNILTQKYGVCENVEEIISVFYK